MLFPPLDLSQRSPEHLAFWLKNKQTDRSSWQALTSLLFLSKTFPSLLLQSRVCDSFGELGPALASCLPIFGKKGRQKVRVSSACPGLPPQLPPHPQLRWKPQLPSTSPATSLCRPPLSSLDTISPNKLPTRKQKRSCQELGRGRWGQRRREGCTGTDPAGGGAPGRGFRPVLPSVRINLEHKFYFIFYFLKFFL